MRTPHRTRICAQALPPTHIAGQKLHSSARAPWQKLRLAGCDSQKLEGCFEWLAQEVEVTVPKLGKVRNQPLDSWEEAFGGFTRRQIQEQIPRRAKVLEQEVLRLRETPVIQFLSATGRIHDTDLLYSSASPLPRKSQGHPTFRALLSLRKIASAVGPRKRPDFTRHLARLCSYVRHRTGTWHDAEIAAILSTLFPTPSHVPQDQEALKKWRAQHGLCGKPQPK
jgi:hypothetical protein